MASKATFSPGFAASLLIVMCCSALRADGARRPRGGSLGAAPPDPRRARMQEVMHDAGITRVIYDEEGVIPDDADDYYYDIENEADYLHPQKELEALRAEKNARGFPQLFPSAKESVLHEKETKPSFPTETELSSGMVTDSFRDWSKKTGSDQPIEEITADPTDTDTDTHFQKDYARRRDPMMLPVTIESKTGSKHKTDDPLKVYGFPKELLPIMPGGGSRFEDVEREKLEKEKMSQTKGTGDDSVESGSSHESEGRYSSASLSSLSLCFYWLVSFHRLDRILLL